MSDQAHAKPNYGAVFVSLFVLTVVEIFVANLPMMKVLIVISLLGLAVVKAGLVAMFYMHLRWEKGLLAFIGFSPLIFSLILTLMVGWDIGHPQSKQIPAATSPAQAGAH